MVKKYLWFILLFGLFLVPLLALFRPGLPITHDGRDQVARISNFAQSLSEGNLIPRWAGNLNWGYGHPILMFLYPLPSYIGSLFYFLGFSLVNSVKIVFGLSFLFSGLGMYLWLQEFLGKRAGFVGGLLYGFAPYRFVDLYVRGAIGECWAFVWPPLILWFSLKLIKEFKGSWLAGGSFSLAALILSHNALSLMFMPVIMGYLAYLVFTSKKKIKAIFYGLGMIFFGFCLAAFFWLPAFFEGKYTLRDIVTAGNITGFEPLSRIIWSPWSYGGTGSLSVQLGILQWLTVLSAPFLIYRLRQQKNSLWLWSLFLLVAFGLSLFLILPLSRELYLRIPLIQKFQFAWRWLSLLVFIPSFFGAVLYSLLPQKTKSLSLFFLILAVLLLNNNYWQTKDYLYQKESFYTEAYPGTTDTGESAPRWSVRFMEHYPLAPIEIAEGRAAVTPGQRLTNQHFYQIKVLETTRLVENTLYFPGWQVLVDGQPVTIEFQDPQYRGLMTFWVSPGDHRVELVFGETRFRRFANFVSLMALIGLGITGWSVKISTACFRKLKHNNGKKN